MALQKFIRWEIQEKGAKHDNLMNRMCERVLPSLVFYVFFSFTYASFVVDLCVLVDKSMQLGCVKVAALFDIQGLSGIRTPNIICAVKLGFI